MSMDSKRYLVTLGMVPDEGTWCTAPSYRDLCTKVQALWCITDVALVYYLHSALGKPTAVRIVTEEDFSLWYRSTRLVTPKLIAHDIGRAAHVQHSSGLCTISPRVVIDASVLQDVGAAYCLKHPAHDEVILVGAGESLAWANAVLRCQRSWGCRRPIFRYLDDGVAGERVVISALTAEDFAVWVKRRMVAAPQLVVFEHAREDLERRESDHEKQQREEKTIQDALNTLTPPAIRNRMSIDEMLVHGMSPAAILSAHGAAAVSLGADGSATVHASQKSASAHELDYLKVKLSRLQAVEDHVTQLRKSKATAREAGGSKSPPPVQVTDEQPATMVAAPQAA